MTVELAASLVCRPPTCLPLCRVIWAPRKSKWQSIHLSLLVSSGVPSLDFSLVSLLKLVRMLLYHVCRSLQSVFSLVDYSSLAGGVLIGYQLLIIELRMVLNPLHGISLGSSSENDGLDGCYRLKCCYRTLC